MQSADDLRHWLDELLVRRRELKRQLFEADASSATLSSGGGSKSYTNRSVDDIKKKIAAIESEIAAVCEDLGIDIPFTVPGGVKIVKVRF